VPAGAESDALLGLVDLPRCLAALTGQVVSPGALPDSENVLPALLGQPGAPGRGLLVLQKNGQRPLALREGSWKLIQGPGEKAELYDLASDPGESRDLAPEQAARVRELQQKLAAEVARLP
jgi:arylsulfatase A